MEALFRIPNKDGEDVDFKLNSAQHLLDENLTGRDLVPKARQEGVSSYYLGRFLAACLMYRNTRAVVISHDKESTRRLLTRVQYYIKNIRGPAPAVQNFSKDEITFPKTNSMFYVGTAGSRQFGRGDTITHLHCSEYAYWPDPKGIMKGLLQAVPMKGEIGIESTGNGYNDYYRRCINAETGRSVWRNHFLPWHRFAEYQLPLTQAEESYILDHLMDEYEESELVKRGLTAGQIAWRRMKLDELDYDLAVFKQEYPMTLDECFQTSSESIFVKVQFEPTDRWKASDDMKGLWLLDGHPKPYLTYVMGGDVAAGVGKDSSVAEIYCVETQEQVGEYINNRIDPEQFAYKLAELGRMFNTAFSVVEQNNHGILTLATLEKVYSRSSIYIDRTTQTRSEEASLFNLGYKTNARTKPLMIGRLRGLLARDWTIHSTILRTELSTFIEDESGKLRAQDGCHDDCVIASACAATGYNKAALRVMRPVETFSNLRNPFLMDNIIKELQSRGGGDWPIRSQEGWN